MSADEFDRMAAWTVEAIETAGLDTDAVAALDELASAEELWNRRADATASRLGPGHSG